MQYITQHMACHRFGNIGFGPELQLRCTGVICPSTRHRRLRPAWCKAARQTVPPIDDGAAPPHPVKTLALHMCKAIKDQCLCSAESPLVRLGVSATTQLLRLVSMG